MTRAGRSRPGAFRRLLEQLPLGALLISVILLCAPPDTRADSAPDATLVPWPLGNTPGAGALSGGLVLLRSKGSRMIRIPAANFFMGSTSTEVVQSTVLCEHEPLATSCDERSFADELLRHQVRLSGFFLDRTEVTVADYDACVRLRHCAPPPYAQGAGRFRRQDLPVTLVTWSDAQAFCAFRGARLPTEAEFERAARGQVGRRFPWGDAPNGHLANHGRLGLDMSDASDGFAELAPVGSFLAGRTPEGFLDLAGNAAEWVRDRYAAEYPDGMVTDPAGPEAGAATTARVTRGGSYESPLAWLRGAARSPMPPSERRPWLGFRCARSQRGPLP